MPLYKNVASQKIAVYAYDTSADGPKTGDAANITAQISKDGGATAATNDVNPTELDATDAKGIYIFDMLQAETNANMIVLSAVSATANIKLEPVIMYTTPGDSTAIDANAKEISDDSTAADNLESACDNYSATRGLAGTALPAVAADGAGGLPISDAGGLDLDTKLANTNEITAARMGALTDWINGGRLDLLLDAIKAVTDALVVKKNTEKAAFPFIMTDSTNHAPATGKTVTVQRSIDGAAYGACANSVTEVGSGSYKITLAAADVNGDTVMLKFTASGCDTKFLTILTVP